MINEIDVFSTLNSSKKPGNCIPNQVLMIKCFPSKCTVKENYISWDWMKNEGRSGQGQTEITQFWMHFLMLIKPWLNNLLYLKFKIYTLVPADRPLEKESPFYWWPPDIVPSPSGPTFHCRLDISSFKGDWLYISSSHFLEDQPYFAHSMTFPVLAPYVLIELADMHIVDNMGRNLLAQWPEKVINWQYIVDSIQHFCVFRCNANNSHLQDSFLV